MKALITGVAGFIGSTLADRLSGDGVAVVGIDSLSDYYDPALKQQNLTALTSPLFAFQQADLNNVDLDALLAGVDVVFHLAGQPGVRGSWGDGFDAYVDANINATQRLLEAVRRSEHRPKVVYASSSSIYGEAESYPTDEAVTPRPRSPYGVTKLAGEHLCRLYAANDGLRTVSLRFFTVYGPKQRPDMAFTRFLRAAVEGTTIHVYGSGEQIRDFTFVDDIVSALIRAAQTEVTPGSVYNVSGGGSHSVNEVLDMIGELSQRSLDITRTTIAKGDVSRTAADITAIKRDLEWFPTTPLRTGLSRQLDWIRTLSR